MKPKEWLRPYGWSVAALLVAAGVGGCAYSGNGLIDEHYARTRRGCRRATRFSCAALTAVASRRRSASPPPISPKSPRYVGQAHRDARRRARGHQGRAGLEGHRADTAVGTAGDRPGEKSPATATRDRWTTSTWRPTVELRARHRAPQAVPPPQRRLDVCQGGHRRGWSGWTHYAGLLVETKGGQRFAVDGWLLASGKPPEIVEVEKWYIDDSDVVFGSKSAKNALNAAPQRDSSAHAGVTVGRPVSTDSRYRDEGRPAAPVSARSSSRGRGSAARDRGR